MTHEELKNQVLQPDLYDRSTGLFTIKDKDLLFVIKKYLAEQEDDGSCGCGCDEDD